ncbi:hypothetical protein [Bradyrhizobium jicamae]|uniref:hypothetical protein n=1 Tax=Bradyrhizobium jicamae TaxID=280332 RepID=UPI001BAC22B4|nr:hypothetical protein [Bradyrhizobium jicamae]MBR0939465.1 hypothetical protein [Bradyrhizobium jicamae]
MPNLPLPLQQDVVIQNHTTGQVDFLEYSGNTLVASNAPPTLALGADWKVVGSEASTMAGAATELVTQSQSTGQVNFLFLDTHANLVASSMGSVVPHIVGLANDFFAGGGQVGQTAVSQLADGSLDLLGFNAAGTLVQSDLITNSVGLPHAVGVAAGNASVQTIQTTQGFPTNDVVVTQLADGSVDFLGFTGTFAAKNVAFTASLLVAGSAGTPPIGAVNQNIAQNFNERDPTTGTEGIHTISQLPSGQLDAVFFDSGINDTQHAGTEYASTLFNQPFSGWDVVDGGVTAHNLFPIS